MFILRHWFVKKSNFVFEDKLFLLIQNTQNHTEKFSLLSELLPLTNLNDTIIYVTLFWQICAPHTLYTFKYEKCIPRRQHNHFQSIDFILSKFDHPSFVYFSEKNQKKCFSVCLIARLKKNYSYILAASKIERNVKNVAGSLHISWNIFALRIFFIFYWRRKDTSLCVHLKLFRLTYWIARCIFQATMQNSYFLLKKWCDLLHIPILALNYQGKSNIHA